MAAKKAAQVSEEIFEVRVCRTCHEILREEGPAGMAWNIAKVRANNAWMPHARFDHKSHAQSKCADCHDVAKSKRSADVAMPAHRRLPRMPRRLPARREEGDLQLPALPRLPRAAAIRGTRSSSRRRATRVASGAAGGH